MGGWASGWVGRWDDAMCSVVFYGSWELVRMQGDEKGLMLIGSAIRLFFVHRVLILLMFARCGRMHPTVSIPASSPQQPPLWATACTSPAPPLPCRLWWLPSPHFQLLLPLAVALLLVQRSASRPGLSLTRPQTQPTSAWTAQRYGGLDWSNLFSEGYFGLHLLLLPSPPTR